MNNLKSEKSSYLKFAVHQPVHWYPWCAEAFEKAKERNVPVLLDIGAVWCHWCHVMDAESYLDEETAAIINENYVAIKVDKDERPDIDSRYQKAVSIFSGGGGWPLTAFLTYDGLFFYGGTYFPKEPAFGLPSYKSVLTEIAAYYRENRDAVFAQSTDFYGKISESGNKFSIFNINIKRINDILRNDDSLSVKYVSKFVNEAGAEYKVRFDNENGGLEESPKFFYFSSLELLVWDYIANREKDSISKGLFTLKRIAGGGVFDHVGGGFHRYSTDKSWIIPHFEKLLEVNAQALRVYSYYYRLTGDKTLLYVINRTLDFISEELYDAVNGGFYASIDADIGDNDDGRFFTWTYDELKSVFSAKSEFVEAIKLFNIGMSGKMHARDAAPGIPRELDFDNYGMKSASSAIPNVLYLGRNQGMMLEKFYSAATGKLKLARDRRKKPFADRIKYASGNGSMIYSLTELSRVFNPFNSGRQKLLDIAAKSAKPFIDIFEKNGDLGRFTSEPGGSMLEDNAYMVLALTGLFETTGNPYYLIYAKRISEYAIKNYYDGDNGGFYDIKHTTKSSKIGFLNHREKNITDYSGYSQNGIMLLAISKMHILTGEVQFRNVILKSFEYFMNEADLLKYNSSAYLISLLSYSMSQGYNIIVGRYGDEKISNYFEKIISIENNARAASNFNSINIFVDIFNKEVMDYYFSLDGYKKGDMSIFGKVRNAADEYSKHKKPVVMGCGSKSCNINVL